MRVARPFFIIPARNQKNVQEKIVELEKMRVPYLIVCGERMNNPNIVYREARVSGMQLTLAVSSYPRMLTWLC
jgi:threonyl-tRNA synthetase